MLLSLTINLSLGLRPVLFPVRARNAPVSVSVPSALATADSISFALGRSSILDIEIYFWPFKINKLYLNNNNTIIEAKNTIDHSAMLSPRKNQDSSAHFALP